MAIMMTVRSWLLKIGKQQVCKPKDPSLLFSINDNTTERIVDRTHIIKATSSHQSSCYVKHFLTFKALDNLFAEIHEKVKVAHDNPFFN